MRFFLPSLILLLCGSLAAKEPLVLLASGLEEKKTAAQARTVIEQTDGATVSQITAKSIAIDYDPAKVKEAQLKESLTASGLTITGQKALFKIKGLVCISCTNTLTRILAKEKGVIYVNSISHLTGQADVSFDPKITSQAKIEAAVNATRYQVVKAKPKS